MFGRALPRSGVAALEPPKFVKAQSERLFQKTLYSLSVMTCTFVPRGASRNIVVKVNKLKMLKKESEWHQCSCHLGPLDSCYLLFRCQSLKNRRAD